MRPRTVKTFRTAAQFVGIVGAGCIMSCGGDSKKPTDPGNPGPQPPATRLEFARQPKRGMVGRQLDTIVVHVVDAQGATVQSSAASVVLSARTPAGAARPLAGTTSIAAANGVARFTTISVGEPAGELVLVASAPSLAGATATPFQVEAIPLVIDSTALTLTSDSTSLAAGVLAFRIIGSVPTLDSGRVIVGGQAGVGFIGRVVSVTRAGAALTVRTTSVPLTDVVQKDSLVVRFSSGRAPTQGVRLLAPVFEPAQALKADPIDCNPTIVTNVSLTCTITNLTLFESPDGSFTISDAKVGFEYDGDFIVNFEGFGVRDIHLGIRINSGYDFAVDLGIITRVVKTGSVSAGTVKFPFVTFIGSMPVWGRVEVPVIIEWSFDAAGRVSLGVRGAINNRTSMTADWTSATGWTHTSDVQPSFAAQLTPQVSASASAKISAGLGIRTVIYNTVGWQVSVDRDRQAKALVDVGKNLWTTECSSGWTLKAELQFLLLAQYVARFTKDVPITRTEHPECNFTGSLPGISNIVVNPTSGAFTTTAGANPAPINVDVTNGGSGTLEGLSATVTYGFGEPQGWLSAQLGKATAPTTLTLTPSVASLPVGNYSASISISSTSAGSNILPVTVPVTLTVKKATSSSPNPTSGNPGSTYDDPHLRTIDGRTYDFMAIGDYTLVASTEQNDDFEVQVRYKRYGSSNTVSVNDAIAARVSTDIVNVYPAPTGFDVIINDETIAGTTSLQRTLPGGGTVSVKSGVANVSWPDQTMVQVRRGGATVFVPYTRLGKIHGLLGNYDGDPANDLRVKNGTLLDAALTGLYDVFRQSWRVPFGTPSSLFRRGPDPFDASFPIDRRTLANLDPNAVAAARVVCHAAGVADPSVLDTCAYDLVVTGDNSWAAISAQFDPSIATLTVTPALSSMTTGATRTFAVVPTGLDNKAVQWTTSGGQISTTGLNSISYTAPSTPGSYIVTATSVEKPAVSAIATVVVSAGSVSGGTLVNGQRHSGDIAVPGQVANWTFTAAQGEIVVLSIAEVTGDADFTPWIRVQGPGGTFVGENWGASAAQLGITAPQTGTYTVNVATRDPGFDAKGSYRLTLAKAATPFVTAPGDEGGTLANGTNQAGSLDVGDLDIWTFDVTQNEAFVVSIAELTGDADLTPWIRLIAPGGKQYIENWGTTAAQLFEGTPATGTYTVIVSSRDAGSDARGTYRLRLAKAPSQFTVPTGDEGGSLINGGNHTGGLEVGDLDMWTFDAGASQTFVLALSEISGDADFTPWIRVISPGGRLILENWDGTATQVSRTTTDAGVYTVIVGTRDAGVDAQGQYRLQLVRAPGVFTVPPGDQGGQLSNGANHDAAITLGDLDAWTFAAAPGETFVLSLAELGGNSEFVPWIRVIAPSGRLVLENWDQVSTQVSQAAVETGTYTVVVSTRDAGLDGQGPYRLILAKVPGPFIVPDGDQGGAIGSSNPGAITRGDLDLWTFSATPGTTFTVTITKSLGGDADFTPWIRVFGPTGVLVGENWGTQTVQVAARATPTGGTYTVIVASRDSGLDATGTYTISATGTAGASVSLERPPR